MDFIKRYEKNPILGPNPDLPWAKDEARNPGAVYDGEKFRMVFTTSTDMKNGGDMVLGYAESSDGFNFECADEPLISPSPNWDDFDYGTVEDTRITEFEGKFYIAYAARSMKTSDFGAGKRRVGPNDNRNPTWTENFRRVGLATTEDWKQIERLGPITSEHISDANVALFPEKIDGKFVFLHRPTPFIPWLLPLKYNPGSIWIVFTDDMLKWSTDKREMPWDMKDEDVPDDYLLIRPEYEWETNKIGASGVPIPTDDGWLTFYHAVDRQGVYRTGLMMLNRDDPRKVIARSKQPIMEPEAEYEVNCIRQPGRKGYPKCIFPTANVVVGDDVFIYYGSQDLYSCLAMAKLKDLIDYVMSCR